MKILKVGVTQEQDGTFSFDINGDLYKGENLHPSEMMAQVKQIILTNHPGGVWSILGNLYHSERSASDAFEQGYKWTKKAVVGARPGASATAGIGPSPTFGAQPNTLATPGVGPSPTIGAQPTQPSTSATPEGKDLAAGGVDSLRKASEGDGTEGVD